jgi:alkylation response protein AidB-like acyl-CoA dehydrogenase
LDFDYTDEQKALKDEARRFLADASPISVVRGVLENPERGHDAALWSRVAEQGWCGAAIPEAYGGHEFGYVELCGLAEELGRSLAPVPFASSIYQFAEALLAEGSEEQKQELLPAVASGETIGTLAVSEGPGTVSAARLATRYANGTLTGTKIPVADGMAAGKAVVLAMGSDGPVLAVTDLAGPGVERRMVPTIDPTRGAATITFDNAPAQVLGSGGDGIAALARIHNRSAVLMSFEQLGGADRALEMARDYALERYAFGRQIGSYQAIKHKLADVFIRIEVARASAYYGAWALSTNAAELPIAAAAARIAGCNAYWQAAKENIQTHGGIGFTWEADPHLHYRRARHLGLVLGSAKAWKKKLTDLLEAQREAANAERQAA